ncbi:iron ABC transporter permease [Sporanaerobium hydrogeniformans]|uniref:Iron ABC transporter permease n=2 Tax=Sporanaerobium hydrogeniformans TaxID=3072179 RepID=A0AC61D9Q0_9FIRM|nr:iron ABC transporter permease [Sporanaerobium hydrogeniformans]
MKTRTDSVLKNQDKNRLIIVGILVLGIIFCYLLVGLNEKNFAYALSKRVPKLYAMLLTGGAIGFSSLLFQTVTHNQLLTPSILGLDSLYMLVNTMVVFFLGANSFLISNKKAHFLLSLVLMMVVASWFYKMVFKKGQQNIFFLLLIGLIVGTLFDSLTGFVQILIDPVSFQTVQSKMQASFSTVNNDVLILATLMIGGALVYALPYFKYLDVLALGRETAISLGIHYDQIVKRMLVIVVLLTATATALVGPITFLGLLVVNIGRYMLRSYKHVHLLMMIFLVSMVSVIGAQFLIERVLNYSMSIGIIINFVGGIYFIYLIIKGRTQ